MSSERVPEWIVGVWERCTLEIAGAAVAGIGRAVWIQAEVFYVDVRAPGTIASGTAFAGPGALDGRVFTWSHAIDMHPRAGRVDRGTLEPDGDELVERGDDLDGIGPYVERWRRVPTSEGSTETVVTPEGIAVRLGEHAALARDLRSHDGGFTARYRRRDRMSWIDELSIGDGDWQPF